MKKRIEAVASKSWLIAKIVAFWEYLFSDFSKEGREKLNDAIQKYVDSEHLKDRKYVRKIKRDILFSRIYYGVTAIQYFLFDFEKLSDAGRKEFVGDREKIAFTDNLHQVSDTYLCFRDKFRAYEIFKKYYHREIIKVSEGNKEEFLEFAKRHPKFILKICDAGLGEGIEIYDAEKTAESAEDLFKRVATLRKYIAEEFIVQSDEMMALNPTSVNTVRFATYSKEEGIMHMFSFLRIGSNGDVIDNATAGGLSAAIDMETGIITTAGWREDLTTYLKHPDTGTQIIGRQVPRWDELLNLVDELAHVIPEQKYVGWDLALTDDGWVMVEGNDSAMMTAVQMCERRGLRKVFNKAFKEFKR